MTPPLPHFSPVRRIAAVAGGVLITALLFSIPLCSGDPGVAPERSVPTPLAIISPPPEPTPPAAPEMSVQPTAEASPEIPNLPPDPAPEPLTLRELEFSLAGESLPGDGFLRDALTFPVQSIDQDFTFALDEVDEAPRPVRRVAPSYPYRLRREGVSGRVILVFRVTAGGETADARVEETTHPDFAAPALEAVQRWVFEPGRKGGQPVAVWVRMPIEFSLQ